MESNTVGLIIYHYYYTTVYKVLRYRRWCVLKLLLSCSCRLKTTSTRRMQR